MLVTSVICDLLKGYKHLLRALNPNYYILHGLNFTHNVLYLFIFKSRVRGNKVLKYSYEISFCGACCDTNVGFPSAKDNTWQLNLLNIAENIFLLKCYVSFIGIFSPI